MINFIFIVYVFSSDGNSVTVFNLDPLC